MLEVEIGCRAALAEVACERGLTALARAEQRDDRARLQAVAETFQLDGTFDHSCILSVERSISNDGYGVKMESDLVRLSISGPLRALVIH